MKNEDRIVELLADLVKGQDRLTGEVSGMKDELKEVNKKLNKLNLHTSENSRAILKLAEEVRLVAEHEKRIVKLEIAVFK